MKMTINTNTLEDFSDLLRSGVEKAGLSEEEKEEFITRTQSVIAFYRDALGEDVPIQCELRRRFMHMEIRLQIRGAELSPAKEAEPQTTRRLQHIWEQMVERKTAVFSRYLLGINHVRILSPEYRSRLSFFKNPIFLFSLAGILLGLVCRVLPAGLSSFLIDDLVSQVLSTVTALMSGIMGPVLFISIVSSVNSLGSIERLNSLGLKVIRRFLLVLLLLTVTTTGVCLLVYRNFGQAATAFDPSEIVSMLLGLIPLNVFRPFTENNISQIVVLGAAFGTALLMLGTKGRPIVQGMSVMQQWVNIVWGFIRRLSPMIPMLNLAGVTYRGQVGVLLGAWKYLLTIFISAALACLGKLAAASVRCRVSPLLLLRKLKPLLAGAFVYGSHTTVLNLQSELEQEKLGVSRTFSDFWIPMNVAVFRCTTPFCYVSAVFYAAHLAGTTFSMTSIGIILLLCLQFSLASPGEVAALTILFPQLGIPLDYIGLFSVYSIATKNILAFTKAMIAGLEELEAAEQVGEVDPAVLKA